MENKQAICKALVEVLQMTSNLYDVIDLEYDEEHEIVIATFAGGRTKTANVRMDSGTSMIKDIISQII